jgi:hypothetical protein
VTHTEKRPTATAKISVNCSRRFSSHSWRLWFPSPSTNARRTPRVMYWRPRIRQASTRLVSSDRHRGYSEIIRVLGASIILPQMNPSGAGPILIFPLFSISSCARARMRAAGTKQSATRRSELPISSVKVAGHSLEAIRENTDAKAFPFSSDNLDRIRLARCVSNNLKPGLTPGIGVGSAIVERPRVRSRAREPAL